MAATARLGGRTRRSRPAHGLRPTVHFAAAAGLTACYLVFDLWFSQPWRDDLEQAVGPVFAWVAPTLLAYVPAVVIGFLIFTLALVDYRPPRLDPRQPLPAVSVLVAAWNEEDAIAETLERLAGLRYAGAVEVVLADNASTDATASVAAAAAERHGLAYRRVFEPESGKHRALNAALATVTTPLVATVDADTRVHPFALDYLVHAVMARPQGQHVAACAGALVVENAGGGLVSRMQSWDYRLGINGVKRMQAVYNSTLVAQGAFSVYWAEDVRAVGGWPDAIGEDIVLTWRLLARRGLVRYEPLAVAFTVVPETVRALMRQRSRWARGMFEGLRRSPPRRQPRVLAKLVSGIDYLVPLLDVGYLFFWIPGVILFLFGYPLIFSWWSMLVIPVTLLIYGFLRRWQERHVFRELGIEAARDRGGYAAYLLLYQALTSAASLRGYAGFLVGTRRRWR